MQRAIGIAVAFCWALLIPATSHAQAGREFVPNCQLPFQSVETEFDQECGIKGVGRSAAKVAESQAKNNFCATNAPVRLSPNDFASLQSASDNLSSDLIDRAPLHNLISVGGNQVGEGTVVEYIAYVLDAHYSNTSGGETVNCKISGTDSNDIHIVLVQDLDDDPCSSITAEMSPHYRPASWTDAAVSGVADHPIRVRGQLFFDSSHQPCRGARRASPPRQSVWEIHPTYAFDICKKSTIDECRTAADTDWVPLATWMGVEEEGGPSAEEAALMAAPAAAKPQPKTAPSGGCTLSCPARSNAPTLGCNATGPGASCTVLPGTKLQCRDANVTTTCSCGPTPSCSSK